LARIARSSAMRSRFVFVTASFKEAVPTDVRVSW